MDRLREKVFASLAEQTLMATILRRPDGTPLLAGDLRAGETFMVEAESGIVMTLREKIFSSLDNAKENKYDFTNADPAMVAADMCMCDATYEGMSDDDMVEIHGYIIEWQKGQRDGKG